MISIAFHISSFLQDYLPRQRGASEHTCDTYAYSFQLLFHFASDQLKVSPSELSLEQIDSQLVCSFLEHLEKERGNTASSRNVRLAAIKSFFRFLEHRLPAALEQLRRVLAIPFKKTDSKLVPYLDGDEMLSVLDAPDPTTRDGIRDRALLKVADKARTRRRENAWLDYSTYL